MKDSPSGPDALYDLGMWDAKSQTITGSELMDFYAELIKDFPIVTIEDAFDEDDWENWSEFVTRFGKDCQARRRLLTPALGWRAHWPERSPCRAGDPHSKPHHIRAGRWR